MALNVPVMLSAWNEGTLGMGRPSELVVTLFFQVGCLAIGCNSRISLTDFIAMFSLTSFSFWGDSASIQSKDTRNRQFCFSLRPDPHNFGRLTCGISAIRTLSQCSGAKTISCPAAHWYPYWTSYKHLEGCVLLFYFFVNLAYMSLCVYMDTCGQHLKATTFFRSDLPF